VLDFGHLKAKHSRENPTSHTFLILDSFKLKLKLFSITRDNASNNSTLYCHLYKKLKREFNNEDKLNRTKLLMYFHSEDSYIQCLAHVINLICKAILKELKASTHKEAKAILDIIANATTE
jgi:hypothetical protein